MSQTPLIVIKEFSKFYALEYGTIEALRSIHLNIEQGELIAIMGPSGSGKSTLLHVLGCLDRPTTGSYSFNHQEISHFTDQELSLIRASQIGFVFQSFNLIPQFNVFENIEVPFLYQSISLSLTEIRQRILHAIACVNLQHRLYHLPSQLSGGESQRVAIARALVTNPLLILADEPTGNLDTENGYSILKLFQELNKKGVTIIIVTHDEYVATHCRRIIRMLDGQIISDDLNVQD